MRSASARHGRQEVLARRLVVDRAVAIGRGRARASASSISVAAMRRSSVPRAQSRISPNANAVWLCSPSRIG